jgi:twitching motility protein PilU
VILIGEIRDRETMDHAIAFAETGHLCLAHCTPTAPTRRWTDHQLLPEERRSSC